MRDFQTQNEEDWLFLRDDEDIRLQVTSSRRNFFQDCISRFVSSSSQTDSQFHSRL